jgi:predicted MFS family arabinose efflux permease
MSSNPTSRYASQPSISDGSKWFCLILLLVAFTCQVVDRSILNLLLEPIKHEFRLSDSQLGLLAGLAYGIPYALAGIPLGMLADRVSRKRLLAFLLTLWSCLTVLSGMAQSFSSLLLARIGLGAAESGCQPNSLSLIADYFGRERRATATGVFFLGSAAGLLLSFTIAGALVPQHGWRAAFFVAGIPGLLLALVIALVLREPQRGGEQLVISTELAPSLSVVLRFCREQKALLHMVAMLLMTYATTTAIVIWVSSYFIRLHGLNIKEVGLLLALSLGVAGAIGTFSAAWAADRLSRSGPHWPARLLAITVSISTLAAAGMLMTTSTQMAIMFLMFWGLFNAAWYGPSYSLCLNLVKPHMRGTVSALILVLSNVLGAALGPQIVGFLSDRFAPWAGNDSLRYSLLLILVLNIFAVFHCIKAAANVADDLIRLENS